ncbi:MAG: biotin--[acetyl-CoA-carboxylase] ligase [Neomegalonema sp.]|nr:biotin--[acetyl-CoA-carboxylase] ligase [Neomegalonema sp.]
MIAQARSWAPDFQRRDYAALPSTNSEARRLYEAGENGGLWVVADQQVTGRGRQNRPWISGEGDLTATYLLTTRHPAFRNQDGQPRRSLAEAATLTFATSLAILELVRDVAPMAPLALKWPNDVLLDGCKLCGILLEAFGSSQQYGLAIGVGINLVTAPPADPQAAFAPTSLKSALGIELGRDEALTVLASHLDRRIDQWLGGGFAAIRGDWMSHAARLGEPIEARLPREIIRGVFKEVDASGALVLDTTAGTRQIAAADVFFPAPN